MDEGRSEEWSHDGLRLRWWPDGALIEMSFPTSEVRGTAARAQEFVDQLERWTGARTTGFGILVDCAGIVGADPAWRAALNEYFGSRAVPVRIAWYNTSTLVRVMVEMFALVTPRVQGKVFRNGDDARTYLREAGYG